MCKRVRENEYVIINSINCTARVIEIYAIPDEFDRLFLIKHPDNTTEFVFESQTIPLNQVD